MLKSNYSFLSILAILLLGSCVSQKQLDAALAKQAEVLTKELEALANANSTKLEALIEEQKATIQQLKKGAGDETLNCFTREEIASWTKGNYPKSYRYAAPIAIDKFRPFILDSLPILKVEIDKYFNLPDASIRLCQTDGVSKYCSEIYSEVFKMGEPIIPATDCSTVKGMISVEDVSIFVEFLFGHNISDEQIANYLQHKGYTFLEPDETDKDFGYWARP